jgi:hypothetical protein
MAGQLDEGQAEVDQVIRNAVGAEVGEDVELTPVTVHRGRLFDVLLGRPSYITCRVQPADLTIVEREVCLLDELTLDLLGVQSGDEVVIEGYAAAGRVVRQIRVKAYRTSDAVQHRRESLHGGDFAVRFPRALDALAVDPDLPWIFLDSALRTALSLGGPGSEEVSAKQAMTTVRLRSSRRYQLKKELREMVLLLGLAFIGIISILESVAARIIGLGVLVALVALVVTIRMRGRLTAHVKRPWRSRG